MRSGGHDTPPDDEPDDLPPAEAARDRRRDRHAHAEERAGMRTGLAKQFKQVLDAQVKRARDADEADSWVGIPHRHHERNADHR